MIKSGTLSWHFVKRAAAKPVSRIQPVSPTSRLARGLTALALGAMCLVQIFVTFRGISTSLGMDSAQIARELARGNGYTTKFIRPYGWSLNLAAGRNESLARMADTTVAPLQPLVLAPIFKLFESKWKFNPANEIYVMDRVVAAVSVLFFLAGIAVTWFTIRRLFDESIACWTTLTLAGCQFLWDVTRSGLPQMMMFCFFSVSLCAFTLALERRERGEFSVRALAIIGVMNALIMLSSPMGLFIALGLTAIVAWNFRPRLLATALSGAIPLLAFMAWAARNHVVSGDLFGSAKTTLQCAMAACSDSWLLRDFSGKGPQLLPPAMLVTRFLSNIVAQFHDLFSHFGGLLPALLFFPALMHPYRRVEIRTLVRALGVVWLFACVGMAITGLPEKEKDANQIHSLFLPVMSGIGFAFLAAWWRQFREKSSGAEKWERLAMGDMRSSWWRQHGGLAIVAGLSVLPFLVSSPAELTVGIANRNKLAQWPPYVPRQITKVSELTKDTEVTVSDMPWAVAWYADRVSLWLPVNREQLEDMRTQAEAQNRPVGGLLMSPLSLGKNHVAEIFTGEYRDWAAPAMRGIVYGLGTDVMANSETPFPQCIPLMGQRIDGNMVAEMTFMFDPRGPSKRISSKSQKN